MSFSRQVVDGRKGRQMTDDRKAGSRQVADGKKAGSMQVADGRKAGRQADG